MKKALLILAAVGAALSALGGMDIVGIITFLPDQWASFLAIAPPIAAASVHVIQAVGDVLDNGIRDNSFKIGGDVEVQGDVKVEGEVETSGSNGAANLLILLLALGCLISLPSCAAAIAAATGEPLQSTQVARENRPPFNVVESDALRAENDLTGKIWGLYDAQAVVNAANFREDALDDSSNK